VLIIVGGSLVLGERLRGFEVVAVVVMLLGGCVSAVENWDVVGRGVLLAAAGCAFIAVQRIIVKARTRGVAPLVVNFYRAVFSATLLCAWLLSTGGAGFADRPSRWAVLAVGALIGPTLGVTLTFQAYRVWDLSRATMLLMAQPLFVLPAAYVFLGTLPTARQFIGGLIILGGGLWLVWMHRSSRSLNSAADAIP
jgi:drug/metabolite transporter (DMT)-like permease